MERPLREDRFRSPHWIYDSHHQLNHYFPARGEVVPTLPGGARPVDFHNGHYFSAGVCRVHGWARLHRALSGTGR